jgi:hypothetical protein
MSTFVWDWRRAEDVEFVSPRFRAEDWNSRSFVER